ncbi:MAG: tetratricopeptide repeat-containing glycosyltransferase family protein [Marivibrio sp.]|uniref:tetratricopeptide repeat-containing glycosyltransferase family protein n=1 Tax=Marivibrio sp. TaxID=2039719 RepID=UPI0032EAD684
MSDEGDGADAPTQAPENGAGDGGAAATRASTARVTATARPVGGEEIRRQVERAVRLQSAGKVEEALAAYRAVLARDSYIPAAWINLGVLLRRTGRMAAAVACLKRGVALKPYDGSAWSNLGNALRAAGRYEEAVRAHGRALELTSGSAQLHYNMALAQRDVGYLEEALHAFRRAEMLGYAKPELTWDRALTYLLQGDFANGFEQYEARWSLPEAARRQFDCPVWEGEGDLDGPLLVWAEQGFGDTLQFCRYLPSLKARGIERLIVEVQGPIARLLQETPAFEGVTVVARGAPLPKAAAHAPLLSLPRVLGTTLETIPAGTPYLTRPAAIPARRAPVDVLNVGLCWAGKPSHRNDRNRSVGAGAFMALFDLPGARFQSLQKGPGARQIAEHGLEALVEDVGSGLKDFAETTAAIEALDLVITVDTSIAHLAGAMGKEVWVVLPYAPDWRWMLHRDDSPWYPSMTLYRQTSPGDWDEVFARVRGALAGRISDKLRARA